MSDARHGGRQRGAGRRWARPPRSAQRWLESALPDELSRAGVVGDLAEEHRRRQENGAAPLRAHLWYWGEAIKILCGFGREYVLASSAAPHDPSRKRSLSMHVTGASVRQAVRRLCLDWRYSMGVVAMLAIGIGPAVAMMSVVQDVLLTPLDYEDPDRLGLVRLNLGETKGHPGLGLSEVVDLRNTDGLFDAVEATSREFEMSMGDADDLVPISGTSVTVGLFPMLGVPPMLGRHFNADDELAPVTILSRGMWEREFGSDPDIVGRTILLNGNATEIVGVMPVGFGLHIGEGSQLSPYVDLWTPMVLRDLRNFWAYPTIVRIAEGVALDEVNAALVTFAADLTEAYPEHYADTSLGFVVHPLLQDLVRDIRPAINAALAGVGLLLAIAIANAAALALARLRARELDLAIRSAIGARKPVLVADILIESVILAASGAFAGGLVGASAVAAIRANIPSTVPRWDKITIGWEVLAYSAAAALIALVLAGSLPAWKVLLVSPWQSLRGTSQQHGSSAARARFALVGAQVAVTVVLAFGAVQLGRTAIALGATRLNFDPEGVMVFRVSIDGQVVGTQADQAAFYERLEDRLRELPSVVAVGAASHIPLSGTGPRDAFTADLSDTASMDDTMANYYAVTSGYIESLRIPLVSGRQFTAEDGIDGERVIIVDETLARTAFPGEDPLGRVLKLGFGIADARIVGVTAHIRSVDVRENVRPQIYVPYGHFAWAPLHFTVRFDGDPAALVTNVRAVVAELGSGRAVSGIQMLSDNVATATSTVRAVTLLVVILAALAALLSALGLYAVVSYVVHQSRRATAIRSALGATPARLMQLHLKKGGATLLLAVPIGVALAITAAQSLASLVYGVGVVDVGSLVAAALLACVTGLLGTYLPARQATKIDPAEALRTE